MYVVLPSGRHGLTVASAVAERRRLAKLVVAAFGTVVAHVLGYQLGGSAAGAMHAYLGTLWWWLAPAGLLAAGVLAVRVARRAELTAVGWSELAALQVGLFAVQEVAERLVDGVPLHDLASPTVLAALLAQLLVAAALVQLIAAAGRTLAEWLEPPVRPRRGRSVVLRPSQVPALVPARIGRRPRASWSSPSLISDDPTHPAHLSEGPRCHSPVRRARWRTPAAVVALAVALVVSACGDSDDPAATDDATTTTSAPTTPAPTPTSGDDATTSTTAGDAATGPEEVAAFDGFSVWLDVTGSYLLRLDETWVPQDDGTVTTPPAATARSDSSSTAPPPGW